MEDHRENNSEIEFDLLEIVRILLGRFWIILCAGVIVALIGFARNAEQECGKYSRQLGMRG